MSIIVSKGGRDAKRVDESGVPKEHYLESYVAANPESLPMTDIREDLRLLPLVQQFPTGVGAIDVLAVDDEGEIYIIETKLFRNPDKRTVVAQVLDYGAALWREYQQEGDGFLAKIETMLSGKHPEGLSARLTEAFGVTDDDLNDLKESISRNISEGRLRFVVLMDSLHDRLRDLIVFLNARGGFTVYAVEMRFYRYDDLEIVIPKLFGAEAAPQPASQRTQWDEQTFFKDASQRLNSGQVQALRRLYDGVVQLGAAVRWGTGNKRGSFNPYWSQFAHKALITVSSNGTLYLNFRWLREPDTAMMMRARLAEAVRTLGLKELPPDYEERFVKVAPNAWTPKVDRLVEALSRVVSTT